LEGARTRGFFTGGLFEDTKEEIGFWLRLMENGESIINPFAFQRDKILGNMRNFGKEMRGDEFEGIF
jgi:hypothetical protein